MEKKKRRWWPWFTFGKNFWCQRNREYVSVGIGLIQSRRTSQGGRIFRTRA